MALVARALWRKDKTHHHDQFKLVKGRATGQPCEKKSHEHEVQQGGFSCKKQLADVTCMWPGKFNAVSSFDHDIWQSKSFFVKIPESM